MEKIDLYKEYHKLPNNYPGESYEQNHEQVLKLAKDFDCVSFMDYGCGKGEQWKNENFLKDLGNKPFLYDPAIPEFNKLPPYNFDMIISTDVFEHIPVNEISNCLDWIYKHAKKCVYLGICTKRAKAKLPNGENAHCSVYPHDWWKEQILIHSSKTFVTTVLTTYPPHDHSRLERF